MQHSSRKPILLAALLAGNVEPCDEKYWESPVVLEFIDSILVSWGCFDPVGSRNSHDRMAWQCGLLKMQIFD